MEMTSAYGDPNFRKWAEVGAELISQNPGDWWRAEKERWSNALMTDLPEEVFAGWFACCLWAGRRTEGKTLDGEANIFPEWDAPFVRRSLLLFEKIDDPERRKFDAVLDFRSTGWASHVFPESPPSTSWLPGFFRAGYAPYFHLSASSPAAVLMARRYGLSFSREEPSDGVCFAGVDGLRSGFRAVFSPRDIADLALVRVLSRDFSASWSENSERTNTLLVKDENLDACIVLGRDFRCSLSEDGADCRRLLNEMREIPFVH